MADWLFVIAEMPDAEVFNCKTETDGYWTSHWSEHGGRELLFPCFLQVLPNSQSLMEVLTNLVKSVYPCNCSITSCGGLSQALKRTSGGQICLQLLGVG